MKSFITRLIGTYRVHAMYTAIRPGSQVQMSSQRSRPGETHNSDITSSVIRECIPSPPMVPCRLSQVHRGPRKQAYPERHRFIFAVSSL